MANNVEIIVEASVADALVKLNLVKHELKDVGDAGGVTAKRLGDPNDRSSLSSAMGNLEKHLRNFNGSGPMGLGPLQTGLARTGGNILRLTNGFDRGAGAAGRWISSLGRGIPVLEQATTFVGDFVTGLGSLVAIIGPVASGVGIATAAFIVLDGILNAVATSLGTVVAIFADLVAPISVVTGLLGGLGIAFLLAAKKALGMHEDGLGQAVSGLKKQFNDLTTTLVGRFMPVFQFLIHNAHDALDFLNRIAKLPLDQAFQQLAQKGIPAVAHFLGQVGSMLAHPIRLAFQIAFGGGKAGNEAATAVSGLWKQLTDFFFGYTQTHKIHIGRAIVVTQQDVQGALQPFIDWFNRHKFTKQGEKIGREILAGLKPFAAPLGQFLVTVLVDAAKQSVRDMIGIYGQMWRKFRSLGQEAHNAIIHAGSEAATAIAGFITSKVSHAWNAVKSAAASAWHTISNLAGGILNSIAGSIRSKLSSAWNSIVSAAQNAWNQVVNFIESHIPHISWSDIIGGALPSLPHIPGTATGGIVTAPQVRLVGEAGPEAIIPLKDAARNGFGLGGVTVNVYGANLADDAQRRMIGAQLGDTILRRIEQQAGR